MNKQDIKQAASTHADLEVPGKKDFSDRYDDYQMIEHIKDAFIAGAEFAQPKWISVNDGIPMHVDPDNASNHVHCLVVRNGDICHLAWNIHHVCWDDADMDDYCCDFLDVTFYMPLDHLPNP